MNALLFAGDMVVMHLMKSFCQPLLIYACECFNFLYSEIAQLCWAWNCIFWRIFKTGASDVVNFHIGIKNLDVELNCRSKMEPGQNF